ncbi:MAG: DUF839 domain-containing protein [Woeseiaceae bacterium]|nr:DUF839 domain-containing protein [Woeseiaceae bacterium]
MPAVVEITGVELTPDRRTLFVNVQHPGGTWGPGQVPQQLALQRGRTAGGHDRESPAAHCNDRHYPRRRWRDRAVGGRSPTDGRRPPGITPRVSSETVAA